MTIYEIIYKDAEGKECVFITRLRWLVNDTQSLAKCIAEEDLNDSGGDLDDPAQWPRAYEIFLMDGKWAKVRVNMDYVPKFFVDIIEEKEGK